MPFFAKKRARKCPKCGAPVVDEDNTFCKKCKYHFETGGTRWTKKDKYAK